MGKKDKKKGRGAEKTAKKTEKNAQNKFKKELAARGEENIENLIAEIQEQDKKLSAISEIQCSQPTPRSGFSLCAHPEKEELLLFGGEYFNGSKTMMYNDLYFYNIRKNQWSLLHCPLRPPPRCSHQAVMLSQGGGQMWVFGGEFASPSRSNFYHYKDLWVFHINERKWEQLKTSEGPSSRSGHRMIACRKQLVVFGGFRESVRNYKYFDDVHMFDLESYKWSKINPVGKGPCPRSGCQIAPLMDGRILIYGGYSREKVKTEVDKGITHTDMFYLQLDERSSPPKWKWLQVKPSGVLPSPRSGFSIALSSNNRAYAFGGVHDEDGDEETLSSVFYNDLYMLELEKGRFFPISQHGKDPEIRKKRRKAKEIEEESEEVNNSDEDSVNGTIEKITISDNESDQCEVKTFEDSIFTVKIGPQSLGESSVNDIACTSSEGSENRFFKPRPRMSASLVVKHGILYLYGGLYENGDCQVTLSDFYALDVHKLDGWRTIVPFTDEGVEWIESEESESDDGVSEEDPEDMDEESGDKSTCEDMDTL